MRRLMTLAVLAAFATTTAFAAGPKLTAENTKIEFTGTKKDGAHNGGFKQVSGSVEMPGDDVTQAVIRVEIVTDSIYTDNNMLTRHLKSPDFFDVRNYPKATFVTTKIAPAAGKVDDFSVTGDLTLHGVTKSITFPAKVALTGKQLTLESSFTIKRKDFGMTYGEGQVNNDVALRVSIKAAR
jgi:polyisoprenoid-binding protein YceI